MTVLSPSQKHGINEPDYNIKINNISQKTSTKSSYDEKYKNNKQKEINDLDKSNQNELK